jgi:hypothetical protein
MYPKAGGCGITASPLMHEIAKMAGIHDVGIKVHGSRNVRNAGEWGRGGEAGAMFGWGGVRGWVGGAVPGLVLLSAT